MKKLRVAVACVAMAAALVAASEPTSPEALPSVRVPVADAEMALYPSGSGRPVIVLVAGYGGDHRTWRDVQPRLSRFARVVSYDRLGSGTSTPSKRPRVASNFVEELREALAKAGFEPPYLLVGHSYGGAMVRLYASRYPGEVDGLLLVDPAMEGFYRRAEVEAPHAYLHELEALQAEADATDSEALRRDFLGLETSMQQLRVAPVISDENIVILSAAEMDLPERLRAVWLDEHARWAKAVGATHVHVKSGHRIPGQRPDAVVDAVRLLRKGKPAQP